MAISLGTAALLAGGSVLGSLVGGLFGSKSQSDSNAANIAMQRETNAQNERLFHENLAWQEDMWNKTNQYNLPREQVQRLLQAGINPAAVFGNGQVSDASMPSAPGAPTLQSPHVQPIDYSFLGQAIDSGVNAFFNNQILSNEVTKGAADSQIAKVNAEFELQTLKSRCAKVLNDSQKSGFEKDQARLVLHVLDKTQQQTITQAQWQTEIMSKEYEQAVNSIAESQLRQASVRIANQYAPKLNDAQLKQLVAGTANLYASARANNASAVESGARKLMIDLQREGVRLDNEQKDSLMDALIDEAWNKADESYWNAQDKAKVFRLGTYGSRVPANSLSDGGRSYTNYNTHNRNSYRGRRRK